MRGWKIVAMAIEIVKIFADHYKEISRDSYKKQGSLKWEERPNLMHTPNDLQKNLKYL